MFTHVLDTDIFIDVQRKYPAAVQWFYTLDASVVAVPGYVALELVEDARNRAEASAAEQFVNMFSVVWPDAAQNQWALDNFKDLHLAQGIGLIDMLIAATARTYNASLVTFNLKHYRNIPQLATLQPYTR